MNPMRALLPAAVAVIASLGAAHADEIKNPIAVFAALDKITGRVVRFEAEIGETVQFGTLQITTRACYSKPPTETPQTVSFLQVDEAAADAKPKRIFSGWMFAASPGLNALEHPVYDVWLLDCKGGVQTIPDVADAPPADASPEEGSSAAQAAPSAGEAGLAASASAPTPTLRGTEPKVQGSNAPGAVPALGPPIDVGTAPVDSPAANPVAPPGPLSPELAPPDANAPPPRQNDDPAAQGDDSSPPADLGPCQGKSSH
jgi:hypothetical protein